MTDPYLVLGVAEDSDAVTLAAARRRRAFEVHPDRGGSIEAMQAVNLAYETAVRRLAERRAVAPSACPPSRPRSHPASTSTGQRVVRDEASFTIDALPAEAFEALLVVTTWMGELLADDPPYVLEAFLHDPEPCWCRLDLVPDAGASTVSLTVAGVDGPAPDVDDVRDEWVSNLNRLGVDHYRRRMAEHIRYDVDGKIGTITIDRPEKRNAMTYAMLFDFIEAVHEAGVDERTSVVVVTGVPGAFCAGTDLADLATVPGASRGLRGTSEQRERWWPLVECPKPTICAVDGPAVGMGAEFTSQCDLRLATTNARFAWNFVHRGLVPDTGAGTWLLPRIVGVQQAMRLLTTGQMIDADEAARIGYVLDVVASEALAERVRQLAELVATGSPHSHRLLKRLVYEGLTASVDEHMQRHTTALAACFASDDHREGVAAFLERRPAEFTGR